MDQSKHTLEARNVKAEYDRLNENTVEKMVRNPNGKGFIMVKVAIDTNAKLFKPKPKKQANPKPQLNSKIPKAPKPAKPKKIPVAKVPKEPKVPKPRVYKRKREPIVPGYSASSKNAKIVLDMIQKGNSNTEIATFLGLDYQSARYYIKRITDVIGDTREAPLRAGFKKTKELLDEGFSLRGIATKRRVSLATVEKMTETLKARIGKEWFEKVIIKQKKRKDDLFKKNYPGIKIRKK